MMMHQLMAQVTAQQQQMAAQQREMAGLRSALRIRSQCSGCQNELPPCPCPAIAGGWAGQQRQLDCTAQQQQSLNGASGMLVCVYTLSQLCLKDADVDQS